MPEALATLSAAWLLGLVGAGHCFAMCGGIVAALSFAGGAGPARWSLTLGYNAGRIAGYALLGGLVAAVAAALPSTGWPVARTVAGTLLIAMGLYVAGWWRGLLWLERGGEVVWRYLKPLGDRFLPLDSPPKAVVVGMIWGWLPCGLVYAALGYAAVQGQTLAGAAVMVAFGLGTLPALLLGGALAVRLRSALTKPRVRLALALSYLLFGGWTIAGAWFHQLQGSTGDSNVPHYHHH